MKCSVAYCRPVYERSGTVAIENQNQILFGFPYNIHRPIISFKPVDSFVNALKKSHGIEILI